jgi:photosystem II stability/assembly factor-like uncharacterized protein
MTVELELTVVRERRSGAGLVAGFAITDRFVVVAGGTSGDAPSMLVSSNARDFEPRATPRALGLRDVLATGAAWWTCGEYGQVAVSRDHGTSWKLIDTGTNVCLFALALAHDGTVWVVGDRGYAARLTAERAERVELGTTARLDAVYAVGDELVVLASDGAIRRWRDGRSTTVATGATSALNALALSRSGTWILVGDRGFIARSPDGAWFARARGPSDADLEGVDALADGRLVAVGDRGHVLVSSDDGRTWSSLTHPDETHLRTVARFGRGALVGGDDGLILRLAPADDTTWQERMNAFATANSLDGVFAAGPTDFVARGLAEYLAVRGVVSTVPGSGNATAFEQVYGVPLPLDAARLRELAAARAGVFHGLTVREHLVGDVLGANLFEELLRSDPGAQGETGLVDAFCGVFCLGVGVDDSYHVELYEWDGPRQVLHYDHERRVLTGVFADTIDSLVYFTALLQASADGAVSSNTVGAALRRLHGKIAPTRAFQIEELAPAFSRLDPRRRDTEFFFYRSRWLSALLRHDGTSDIADIRHLFDPDFNQVVPHEQLPARFESCERLIPTALYAMWRAFVFDEPELSAYLEIGRHHRARLVRDSAALIDELRAGRNELATIRDVQAHLAAFRALDLDPRRAGRRALEADARRRELAAELARTPRAGWVDLAWRWVGDGAAHRALFERLAGDRELAVQLAALARIAKLADAEREQLARELAPELEALLVGTLVRGDELARYLPDDNPVPTQPPGWDAIDRALSAIYGEAEPYAHYGDALDGSTHGISVYVRDAPVPHFHFVTYGLTDSVEDRDDSGAGIELTFRLARVAEDMEVPEWVLEFLPRLARHAVAVGARLRAGDRLAFEAPFVAGVGTALAAVLLADDPELGAIQSPLGHARFVQAVGITRDEYRLGQQWSPAELAALLSERLPWLVTDLTRTSVLGDPQCAAMVMSERALRLAPCDPDVQQTHAQLLLDGGRLDDLMVVLSAVAPAVRVEVAARLGELGHARFAEALAAVLREPVPDDLESLGRLATLAVLGGHRELALGLYEQVLALPVPEVGAARRCYVGVLNDACVLAHDLAAYEQARNIADRSQAFGHEHPSIYHSAACAYAALGDYAKAFEQVKLAVEHDYDHLPHVEVDRDLGPLLEWPEFKALFRDWRARQEGN